MTEFDKYIGDICRDYKEKTGGKVVVLYWGEYINCYCITIQGYPLDSRPYILGYQKLPIIDNIFEIGSIFEVEISD